MMRRERKRLKPGQYKMKVGNQPFAIKRNSGRNENGKSCKQRKRQRSTLGGCRLSDPEAQCNGSKVSEKAPAGMEREQGCRQNENGRMAGHVTQ